MVASAADADHGAPQPNPVSTMKLLSLLSRRRPVAVLPNPQIEVADAAVAVADDETPPRGCGWFDSSHDLHEGLCVQEHSADSLARELPLSSWLELQLAGWRVAQAA